MAVWQSTDLQNRLSQVRVLHTVPSRRATRTLPGIHKDISVTLGIYTALDKKFKKKKKKINRLDTYLKKILCQLGLTALFLPLFDLHFDLHFKKTFREIRVITAHIPLERLSPSQTKIPEKPGAKPLFGDFCCFIFCYSCI